MRQRDIRVRFRVNEAENARLVAMVGKSGLDKEPFLRQMVLNGYVRAKPPADYFRLVAEVNMIGNNINQIARIANADERISPDSVEEIKRLQRKLLKLVKED